MPAPDFSLIGSTSYSLGAGQSATITVRFMPTSTGAKICLINTGGSCPPDIAGAMHPDFHRGDNIWTR